MFIDKLIELISEFSKVPGYRSHLYLHMLTKTDGNVIFKKVITFMKA